MFLLDRFFDGTFFTYGIEVMSFADRDQEDRIDPMIYVFPRYSKLRSLPGSKYKNKSNNSNFLRNFGRELLHCTVEKNTE